MLIKNVCLLSTSFLPQVIVLLALSNIHNNQQTLSPDLRFQE